MKQSNSPSAQRLKLGEQLLINGMITTDQLEIALIEQRKHATLLGQQLVRLNFVSDALIRDILAQQFAHQSIDLSVAIPDSEVLKLVPETLARQYKILPLMRDQTEERLTVAMVDVTNVVALDQLRRQLNPPLQIEPLLATEVQIEQALDRFYGHVLSIEGILQEIEEGTSIPANTTMGDSHPQRPIVRLINAILLDAVKQGASDVHFEPEQAFLRIRYRLDGVLWQVRSLHQRYWPAMCVRLKLMAGMDIAEQRAAQDGRMSAYLCGRSVDFRVSTQPTLHGENIVLRVLDREKASIQLDQLDLPTDQMAILMRLLAKPEGMLILTGPTGSGKTTTLYAMLSYLNQTQVNIMTLEDPVEYPMPMMRQTSVHAANKVDFANGIRAIMRQDPDIILVGEVRDEDTAQMALRAAMTGHLVMTTLHTNHAPAAFARLQDLGLTPALMAGHIIGVIGQRLLRKLCLECRQLVAAEDPISAHITQLHATLLDTLVDPQQIMAYRPVGCTHCRMSGYRGRIAILEILEMHAALEPLIVAQASAVQWQQSAAAFGYRRLAAAGLRRVLSGETSLSELQRVVDLPLP